MSASNARRLELELKETMQRAANWEERSARVVARLEKDFGFGEDEALRRQLYGQLQDLINEHGMPVWKLVKSAFLKASAKELPDRWFCRTIVNDLTRQGFLSPSWNRDLF